MEIIIIDKTYFLIQKDTDMDGYPDKEMSYELSFTSVQATTYAREKSTIYFKPKPIAFVDPSDQDISSSTEYIKQYLKTDYREYSYDISIMFRDFEQDEVLGSRLYKDIFPNELTEKYDLNNYLKVAINDLDDSDMFNDIEAEVIDMEPLLSLTHETDNVPAAFDSVRRYLDGIVSTENILSSIETINVPGSQNVWNELDEIDITSEVVKLIPKDGVYYDNALGYRPEKYEDGAYYYFDGNSDGTSYETIFITDNAGNIIGVGFDYDYDHYFNPHKRVLIEKHIRRTKYSEEEGKFNVKNLIYYELLGHHDENDYDGIFLEPTFSDALFDLWKTHYDGCSSALFEEVSDLTFDKFMETVTTEKVAADVAWQVESLLISAAVSVIATTPIAGALVYAGLNMLKGYLDIREQENIIRAHTFHSEDYRDTEVLSDDWIFDDWFGGMMTTGLTGNQYGVYMPVIYETRKHRYEGQLILAPYSDEKKTTTTLSFNSENIWDMFDSNINNINLDYSLQSRSYMGYSDLDDVRLTKFFKETGLDETSEVMYAPNSITYLENEIARTSDENNDYFMDTVLPYMHDYYPIMTFVDSEQYASLPEFYEDYPIIVSDEVYEAKLKDQYDRFFKVWEKGDGQEFRIIPKNNPHTIKADIEYIEVYIVTYKEEFFVTYKHFDTIAKDDYEFDEASGKLIFEKDIIDDFNDAIDKKEQENNYYDYCIILEFFVEKYRSIDDTGELTSEQMEQIATMQSIQASVLEYYYQFQLATESQQKLNEIAYTVVITVISTAITLGIGSATGIAKGSLTGLATEPLEEVFIDPLIESVSTGITRELGGDKYAELIVSTLAESARESQFGIFATQQQYQQKKALKAQGYNDVEIRQIMKGEHEQVILQKEEQSTARKVAKAALLTLSIFSLASLGIGGSMLFGSLGTMGFATASAFLIASGKLSFKDSFSVAIGKESLEDIFEHVESDMKDDPLEGLFPAWDDPVYNEELDLMVQYDKHITFGGMKDDPYEGLFEVSNVQKSRQKPNQEFWQKLVEQIMEKTGKTYIDLARQAQYGDKWMENLLKDAYGTPKPIMVAKGERGIPRIIAEAYINELVRRMPKKWIREILIKNHIISKRGLARASVEELIELASEHGLRHVVENRVFVSESGLPWAWPRRLVKILNERSNIYYKFGKHIFSKRFGNEINVRTGILWSNTKYDEFTLEKLIDYFIKVEDPDLDLNARTKILKSLDIYAREIGLNNYKTIINKPIWLLGKVLQETMSKQKGEFISITEVGRKVLHDEHAFTFRYESDKKLNKHTINTIMAYCTENLKEQKDLDYINSLIEVVAYANNIIILTPYNPKLHELNLINKISEKVGISEFEKLATYLGFSKTSLWSKTHMSKTRIHNVFYEKDIQKISDNLKAKLNPIDPRGCKDLLIELGNYDSAKRQAQLKNQFPTYDDWVRYKNMILMGDPEARLPSNWVKIREKVQTLFYTQQGEHIIYKRRADGSKYPVKYSFDAFTGREYKTNALGWELHHIDFNEEHNSWDNFLWVMALKDPVTGQSSHKKRFSSEQEKKAYIAEGMMIKIAFKYGYAPRSWDYETQAYYYETIRKEPRRFISDN